MALNSPFHYFILFGILRLNATRRTDSRSENRISDVYTYNDSKTGFNYTLSYMYYMKFK